MSDNQTNLNKSELLNTQLSVAENPNNSVSTELIERYPVENTPFVIVGNPESGYFLSFGKYRLTEYYDNPQLCKNAMGNEIWNIMLNLMALFSEWSTVDTINKINDTNKKSL